MIRFTRFIALALTALGIVCAQAGDAQPRQEARATKWTRASAQAERKYVPGEVLVRFKAGVPQKSRQAAHATLNARVLKSPRAVDRLDLVKLSADTTVEEAIRSYRKNPDVLYAEPNYVVRALGVPNDPRFPEMWGLNNIGQGGGTPDADIDAVEAWDITTGSSDVVVAVIDSGIDYTHPDLMTNLFQNTADCNTNGVDDDGNGYVDDCYGIDTFFRDSDPFDDNGHGTHVAGTIGAAGNNSLGVVGVNWTVRLMPCKFIGPDGYGDVGAAIACLDYVRMMKDRGVNVVATNNSWGGGFFSQALQDAIDAQRQSGILFIASAGNEFADNDTVPSYPANINLPSVISVAATTREDSVASFSNLGRRTVHIGAPGHEVLSTLPGGAYGTASGTSMAAPHVAGVAALLKAQDPSRDWRAIKNLILAGGDTIPALDQTITGKRLNAYGALTCVNSSVQSRLQPINDVLPASLGSPVNLAVLNINCAQPAGTVSVSVSPGGGTVTLVDDGTGSDMSAGDGIYSGQWVPQASGTYTLTFSPQDSIVVTVLDNYAAEPTGFSYRTISGTGLNLGDDEVARIISPFSVRFGGGSFYDLYVSANGTISFTGAFSEFLNNFTLPVSDYPVVTLVAPFWQDLLPIRGTPQNVYWEVVGTAPNRELVIEWRDVRSFNCPSDAAATVRFQTVLFEANSDILFNYADATFAGACTSEDNGAGAVVGLQVSPTLGETWSHHARAVGDAFAIRWRIPGATPPPPNPVPSAATISPSSAVLGSPSLVMTVTGSNFVPVSRVRFKGYDRYTMFVSATELQTLIPAIDLREFGTSGPSEVTVFNPSPGGGLSNAIPFQFLMPVPVITSISPSSVMEGSLSFRMDIFGSGFSFGSKVQAGGIERDKVFYDTGHIVALMHLGDVATAGTKQIQVINPSPGGGGSNIVSLAITPRTAQATSVPETLRVAPGVEPPEQGPPREVMRFLGWNYALKKGKEYLQHFARPQAGLALPLENPKTPSRDPGATVSTQALPASPPLPGFDFREALPAGLIPTWVATGDFNRDGFTDWVVSNGGEDSLWVYEGQGNGTARLPRIIRLRGRAPIWVTAADLRKTGVVDLIVADADSGAVEVLLGNGDGTFAPGVLYPVPGIPTALAVDDFDGNGTVDVVAGLIPDGVLTPFAMLPGDGSGRFGVPRLDETIVGFLPLVFNLTSADFNGDGLPDLLSAEGDGIHAYINRGNGTFKHAQYIYDSLGGGGFVSAVATGVALGDMDEDGCLDAGLSTIGGGLGIMYGNCDGTFQNFLQRWSGFGIGEDNFAFSFADLNSDGHLDFVATGIQVNSGAFGQSAGNLVSILLGDGRGNLNRPRVFRGEPGMFGFALADLNGDGRLDIVTANQDSDSASVYLNDGSGGFTSPAGDYIGYHTGGNKEGASNAPFSNFTPLDVNGDGKLDLAMIQFGRLYPEPYQMTVLLGDGNGNYGPPIRSPAFEGRFSFGDFRFGNFRGTGRPDFVAVGSQFSGGTSALLFAANRGDGTFGPARLTLQQNAQGKLGVGDFNRDGRDDVVVLMTTFEANSPGRLAVYFGNSDGTFSTGPVRTFSTYIPAEVLVRDVNGDSKLDVLMWDHYNLFRFLGNGDGSFSTGQIILPNLGFPLSADLNRDGRLDLVEVFYPENSQPTSSLGRVTIYLGQPDGTFLKTNTYEPYAGNYTTSYLSTGVTGLDRRATSALADFNGDGNLDIAFFQNKVLDHTYFQILLGLGDGTFMPSYTTFELHKSAIPQQAFDQNGDGRDDLVEVDHFTASFHSILARPGVAVQARMLSDPVIGTQGRVRISVALPAASGTAVTLAASDPAISIPPSITIPSGSVSQDVPFQIDPSFDPHQAFSIRATLGSDTAVVCGVQSDGSRPLGVRIGVGSSTPFTVPGAGPVDYSITAISLAGYETELSIACQDLPPGVSCNFRNNSLIVPAGAYSQLTFQVSTVPTVTTGTYTFKVVATDGSITEEAVATLQVADFTLSISPASQTVSPPTTYAFYTLTVTPLEGFSSALPVTCTGLPVSGACDLGGSHVGTGSRQFNINVQALPAGTHNFTVTATYGPISRSASAELTIAGVAGSVSPASATIAVGGSADMNITMTSQGGMTGQFTLSCLNPPAAVSCSFNPATVTLPANGNASTVLTVRVNSRPTATLPLGRLRPPTVFPWLLMYAATILCALVIVFFRNCRARSRRWTPAWAVLVLLFVTLGALSCGGGGGDGGGGTRPPPPPPPPPAPVSVVLTVQATSGATTQTIGTVTVTVP